MNKFIKLSFCIIICELAGIIGTVFTIDSISTWYPALTKPFFNPPSWLFGPTWTSLYFLMGVSLYLVWDKKKTNLKWFWTQLALNAFWSIIFFGFKNPVLAFFEIVILWISILLTIKSFYKVNKNAAYLLVPYIGWVTFAGILNLFTAILNK